MTDRFRNILRVGVFGFLVAGVGLAGCNTIEGAGEDVERAGEEIEEEAEDASD